MKDDWIEAALVDDAVVAEMLFRLKQSRMSQTSDACVPPAIQKSLRLSLPPLQWGNRQPRSKSSIHKWSRCGATAARSPNTPLSWSGGSTSPSDGGCDESSRPPSSSSDLSSAFRSKCTVTNEMCNISCSSQGCKRKKTFDELKEEENSLLKERVDLERDLASEHVNLNQERARSENLKKIKVDLKVESGKNSIVKQCHEQETIVKASSYQCENKNLLIESTKKLHPVLPRQAPDDEQSPTDSHRDDKKAVVSRGFVLPDLNMDPSEEEIE
ncbi:unnamed protein product [Cuscuta europaea]|uniref:Uncharacterized protein n=1 Tax=Cuscuta europaea TaxID=41803 RepID=A0A9P0Z2J3_CUSEU|nr:unnamed protein product [Cuscuta europaea]